ncbi:MAG: DUF4432 family protein [Paenibacillaceae bacterium]
MQTLYKLPKAELLKKIGGINQLAGIQALQFNDSRAKGLSVFDVRNSRLRFHVLADRGMDIGQIEIDGVPAAWMSSVGYASPCFYEPDGSGWLRNFSGGLLTTCGLTQTGEPCQEGSEQWGLHGRISNTPSYQTGYEEYWEEEIYHLVVKGKVKESSVFGETLEMTRTISTTFGSMSFTIEDKVVNQGQKPTPLMLNYHMNLGFPIVNENSFLVCNTKSVRAWSGASETNLKEFYKMPPPSSNVDEEVIHLDLQPFEDGTCMVVLVNSLRNFAFYIKFKSCQFPEFSLWKGIREGIYCLGFEPANCGLNGRVEELRLGNVDYIEPFQERVFQTEVGFLMSEKDIREWVHKHFQTNLEAFESGEYYTNSLHVF